MLMSCLSPKSRWDGSTSSRTWSVLRAPTSERSTPSRRLSGAAPVGSRLVRQLNELGFYVLAGHSDSPRDLVDDVRLAEELGLGAAFISERFNTKDQALSFVGFRECRERVVERHQVLARLGGDDERLVERDFATGPAALLSATCPCVVHEDAPHYLRRDGKKVRPILPADHIGADQPHKRLVDERRRLKRVLGTLSGHATASDPMQLLVDQRHQLLEGVPVASCPPE